MGCLVGARYSMLADIYPQTTVRNRSGQVIRKWDYENPYTVKNLTVGILGGGIRVVGSTEIWGEDYEEVEWAKMYISDQVIDVDGVSDIFVTRRFRVGNIRQARSPYKPLWVGDDGESIVFNIMGITPIMDPFGRPAEYELLLKGETGD
jgi:hypothetical protein